MDRLNRLAKEAAQTKGASFLITHRKGEWKVNFNNQGKSFVHPDLGLAADRATYWLTEARNKTQLTIKQFEIF